jgi:predicted nucleic acid-binding protein
VILFDTSVWIDYLRGEGTAAAHDVRRWLVESVEDIVICEPVAMELVAGAPDDAALSKLERLVNGLPSLPLDSATDFRTAAEIFRSSRRAGRTVRSLNDCLIATIALRHRATLVHKDADYEVIASLTELVSVSFR